LFIDLVKIENAECLGKLDYFYSAGRKATFLCNRFIAFWFQKNISSLFSIQLGIQNIESTDKLKKPEQSFEVTVLKTKRGH